MSGRARRERLGAALALSAGSSAAIAELPLHAQLKPADVIGCGGATLTREGAERYDSWLLPYQAAWVLDESPVAICEKSRRIGMDYAEAFRAVHERIRGRTIDYWYSSADESAAAEFMEYVRFWAVDVFGLAIEMTEEREAYESGDVRVMSVRLPASRGSTKRPRITAMTSNPKRFRSKGGDVCLSEFAFHQHAAEVWKAAAPVATWGGARMRLVSTHNGEGSYFDELLGQARRHVDPERYGAPRATDVRASVHRITIHDAVERGLVERINRVSGAATTREAFLEGERRRCANALVWGEEYECRPNTSASSYLPYELTRACTRSEAPAPTESLWAFLAGIGRAVERYEGAGMLYAGCDIGRTQDRFVMWAILRIGAMMRTVGVLAWRGAEFPLMQGAGDALLSAAFGGRRVARMCIDASGIGRQMAEHWARRFGGRAEACVFTATLKDTIYPLTRRHVEERTVTLPDDPVVLADLASVSMVLTAAGNARFDAERTAEGHGDHAAALALALHAAERGGGRVRAYRGRRDHLGVLV